MYTSYHKKMDPLEVPTDCFVKVQAIKSGAIYLAKRCMGGTIIIRDIDGHERRTTIRAFGKLYRKPTRSK